MKKLYFLLGLMAMGSLAQAQCTTTISTFPYSQDFENGAGGWTSGITSGSIPSTWALGTPAGTVITGAASGTKAWATNLAGNYNNNENSYVKSPCFNFSALTGDPDFEMRIWWNSEFSWDGAVLQSSINGGTTWQNVGALNDPNNWYNDGTINGNPGGQQVGWSGAGTNGSNGWVKAKHKLNGLAGQSSVILRVAFGSDGSVNSYDGIAFDDIRIGDNTNNIAVSSFVPLTQICGFGAAEKVEVVLANFGSVAVSNYTVEYRLTGPSGPAGPWIAGQTGPTLQPDSQTPYIFNSTVNLTGAGAYTIEVRVTNNQGTDPELINNNLTYNITNALYTTFPVSLDFETPTTGISSARIVTKSRSAITEVAGVGNGTTASKGLIMDGIDSPTWEIPVGLVNPWNSNPDNFSGVFICLGPTNIGPDELRLTLDLKQFYKITNYNTNFRVTVNGKQVSILENGVAKTTLNPPFGGYGTAGPAWKNLVVDLTPFKNAGGIQIGLESSVREGYQNGTGTANVIDNIQVERITVNTGIKENALQSKVLVFPNPSTGLFKLKVPAETRKYAVEISDLTGKTVKTLQVNNNSGITPLNLQGTAKGIYILKITSEGNIATRKLIIE